MMSAIGFLWSSIVWSFREKSIKLFDQIPYKTELLTDKLQIHIGKPGG